MKKLTIIIPAYNEEAYIKAVLQKVFSVDTDAEGFEKEIIVVDDCSTDQTASIVRQFDEVIYIKMPVNRGKGAAVRRGINQAAGDWLIIQDADLEYSPDDYIPMLRKVKESNSHLVAVYGSRPKGQIREHGRLRLFPGKHPQQGIGPWLMNHILGLLTLLLYGKYITDNLTAYKLYPAQVVRRFDLKARGFEGDHEITANLIKNKIKILEVPINYEPRTVEQGKKIRMVDGLIAIWTFIRCRFT